jgi:hypothetical protein
MTSSSSTILFTKTAPRGTCPVSSGYAPQFTSLSQLTAAPNWLTNVGAILQISSTWSAASTSTSTVSTTSLCGSSPLGRNNSFFFYPNTANTVRQLQAAPIDLRYAPVTVTFWIRFGVTDSVSPYCGLNTPAPTSEWVQLSYSHNANDFYIVSTIYATNDNDWHYYSITLPSGVTQSDGDLSYIQFFQNVQQVPQASVFAIQDIRVYAYVPTNPTLIITSYSPQSDISSSGGTIITVIGSGFNQIESVTGSGGFNGLHALMCSFNGVPATNVIRVNDTMIMCITPPIAWTQSTLTFDAPFDICGASFVSSLNTNSTISFTGKLHRIILSLVLFDRTLEPQYNG